jgi:integrase
MARTIKDTQLDTRTARARLKPSGKPYYRKIEEGLHLGYRKPRGRKGRPAVSGKWVLRRYIGGQSYTVEVIGIADDFADADGNAILNFTQAQNLARARLRSDAGVTGPLTVAAAIEGYFEALRHEGKDTYDAQTRANAFIVPALGSMEVSQIKAKALRNWLSALADKPPRVRAKNGAKEQRYRADFDPDDDEFRRQRRSTANRTLNILRAALNRAFEEGLVSSDTEWRRVKSFRQVDPKRIRFLTLVQSKRLINAAGKGEFRPLVEAALQTGARYGELTRLQVLDFNEDAGTLTIRKSKSGRARTIFLTPEGVRLFRELAIGCDGHDLLLRRKNGRAWTKSQQGKPIKEACKRAGITPPIRFHELRHTYGSLLAMAGVPMKVIAESLGHASTQVTEKHYAALAPSHVADTIRKHLPKFGAQRSNVVGLR